jgi:hypothetical protein
LTQPARAHATRPFVQRRSEVAGWRAGYGYAGFNVHADALDLGCVRTTWRGLTDTGNRQQMVALLADPRSARQRLRVTLIVLRSPRLWLSLADKISPSPLTPGASAPALGSRDEPIRRSQSGTGQLVGRRRDLCRG